MAGGTSVLVEPGGEQRWLDNTHVVLDPRVPEQFHRLLCGSERKPVFQGVINCWSLDLRFDLEQVPDAALAEQAFGYASALHIAQALVRDAAMLPLCFVTAGAAPIDDTPGMPGFDALSALRKTLQAEYPETRCRLIDLENGPDPSVAAAMLEAELERSDEPEVALRGRCQFAPRLVAVAREEPVLAEKQVIELVAPLSGLIDELGFATHPRISPLPSEVEIEVRATGLNFRDVLNALGMLPGSSRRLGGECAGLIVRAGAGTAFAPGDPVVAFCPGQSGSFVTVPARHVVRKPERLDFAQAAGLPIAYMTALYGLYRLADLQSGPNESSSMLQRAGSGQPLWILLWRVAPASMRLRGLTPSVVTFAPSARAPYSARAILDFQRCPTHRNRWPRRRCCPQHTQWRIRTRQFPRPSNGWLLHRGGKLGRSLRPKKRSCITSRRHLSSVRFRQKLRDSGRDADSIAHGRDHSAHRDRGLCRRFRSHRSPMPMLKRGFAKWPKRGISAKSC